MPSITRMLVILLSKISPHEKDNMLKDNMLKEKLFAIKKISTIEKTLHMYVLEV